MIRDLRADFTRGYYMCLLHAVMSTTRGYNGIAQYTPHTNSN